MSFARQVYLSAILSGWAAFLGWGVSEAVVGALGLEGDFAEVLIRGGLVGGAIGAGLGAVGGLANGSASQILKRAVSGVFVGAIGGAWGSIVGQGFYAIGFPRALGWLVAGLGIGVADGLFDRSQAKIRNGLIGGGLGGLVGGILFLPVASAAQSSSGMFSRALGFTIVGICIGALIGLVQVVLKRAWLTVLDGYRVGRQLILHPAGATLGRGEHLPLPFLGPMNQELEVEHLRITFRPPGSFVAEDAGTLIGSRLNNQALKAPTLLKDGDVLKIGHNFIRFNERARSKDEPAPTSTAATIPQVRVAPPPPPVKKGPVPGGGVAVPPAVPSLATPAPKPTAPARPMVKPVGPANLKPPGAPPASKKPADVAVSTPADGPASKPLQGPAAKPAVGPAVKPNDVPKPRGGGIPPPPPPPRPKS